FLIHDDDVIAVVDMRREGRLMLAAQAHGDNRREPAYYQSGSIDQNPLFFDLGGFGRIGLHGERSSFRSACGCSRLSARAPEPSTLNEKLCYSRHLARGFYSTGRRSEKGNGIGRRRVRD